MRIKTVSDACNTPLRETSRKAADALPTAKSQASVDVKAAALAQAEGIGAAVEAGVGAAADAFDTGAPKLLNEAGTVLKQTGKAGAAVSEPALPAGPMAYKEIANAKLFVKGAGELHAANPSDISQGAAQDCWFLSSLATIAKNKPELLEKNIADNGDGTYTVTLYPPSVPGSERDAGSLWGEVKQTQQVVVTGALPQSTGAEVFAAAIEEDGTPELWVALYEKALAKFSGGYENLLPSSGTVGMALIAGAQTTQSIASQLDFSQVAEWFKNGDGLTVVSMPSDIAPEIAAYRDGTLVAEHVYYVSNVDAENGTVEIRNPFGWGQAPVSMPWDEFKNTLGWIDHGVLPR